MRLQGWPGRGRVRLALTLATLLALVAILAIRIPSWWVREAGLPPRGEHVGLAWGSGFFVNSHGWVLTNRHVVDGCLRVTVGDAKLSAVVADKVLFPTGPGLDLAAVHLPIRPAAHLALRLRPGSPGAAARPLPRPRSFVT